MELLDYFLKINASTYEIAEAVNGVSMRKDSAIFSSLGDTDRTRQRTTCPLHWNPPCSVNIYICVHVRE